MDEARLFSSGCGGVACPEFGLPRSISLGLNPNENIQRNGIL